VLDYFQRNRHFIGYAIGFVGVFIGLWAVATLAWRVQHDQVAIRRQNVTIERQQQQIQHAAHLGLLTYKATCTLRSDLVRRVRDSTAFLAAHPNGVGGISQKTILQSIVNEQATIRSLDRLRCPNQAT